MNACQAHDLLDFLAASPSPWHAVASVEKRLLSAGFLRLEEQHSWQIQAGGRYYVVRQGASIIAFVSGAKPVAEVGLRIVGAHTDSPGLRLKPCAAHTVDGVERVGVEVYGGPILATFSDRDLGLAGRVAIRPVAPASLPELRLVHLADPVLRLPNLAIHMNREVNEQGLRFNKQTELPLILGMEGDAAGQGDRLLEHIAQQLEISRQDILAWDLAVCDTQRPALWGLDQEFIAASQLDNLASCHAALSALLMNPTPSVTAMCAFFDHEEVGSESASGASGSFLTDVLSRLSARLGLDQESWLRALARSLFISADMAHAWHPNFPAAYEPQHRVRMNHGPVIKSNANQRYSSQADTAARFKLYGERAGVPVQQYSHRSDLGCGSTIGPIIAARLGIPSVDVGCPMWAMHSLRESAGVLDHGFMIAALSAAFADTE